MPPTISSRVQNVHAMLQEVKRTMIELNEDVENNPAKVMEEIVSVKAKVNTIRLKVDEILSLLRYSSGCDGDSQQKK